MAELGVAPDDAQPYVRRKISLPTALKQVPFFKAAITPRMPGRAAPTFALNLSLLAT